jgi:hypothetical protein
VDASQFFSASAVTIVAGKGGVGKTTVSATLAHAAASRGLRVLLVEIEGKATLPALFGHQELTYDEITLLAPGAVGPGSVTARALTPDAALVEYLSDHGFQRISRRLSESGAVDIVATATPGIKDVLILGKIKQIERAGVYDAIIVDAPAAGHAISFLRSASGLLDAVSAGPIQLQAAEVAELLADPARCQVMLVTLPEETPVNEVIETAFSLEDRIGVALGPVVVNARLEADPALVQGFDSASRDVEWPERLVKTVSVAAQYRVDRAERQRSQCERLQSELPLGQLSVPFVFRGELGPSNIAELAEHLLGQIDALEDLR